MKQCLFMMSIKKKKDKWMRRKEKGRMISFDDDDDWRYLLRSTWAQWFQQRFDPFQEDRPSSEESIHTRYKCHPLPVSLDASEQSCKTSVRQKEKNDWKRSDMTRETWKKRSPWIISSSLTLETEGGKWMSSSTKSNQVWIDCEEKKKREITIQTHFSDLSSKFIPSFKSWSLSVNFNGMRIKGVTNN